MKLTRRDGEVLALALLLLGIFGLAYLGPEKLPEPTPVVPAPPETLIPRTCKLTKVEIRATSFGLPDIRQPGEHTSPTILWAAALGPDGHSVRRSDCPWPDTKVLWTLEGLDGFSGRLEVKEPSWSADLYGPPGRYRVIATDSNSGLSGELVVTIITGRRR